MWMCLFCGKIYEKEIEAIECCEPKFGNYRKVGDFESQCKTCDNFIIQRNLKSSFCRAQMHKYLGEDYPVDVKECAWYWQRDDVEIE